MSTTSLTETDRASAMTKALLGIGILSRCRGERVSDRYGSVMLFAEADRQSVAIAQEHLVGKHGRLIAKVLRVQESDHIGDIFRGFVPGGAKLGDSYILGEGRLFSELTDDTESVGLKPIDGRTTDWLDPDKLYIVHNQLVELYFEQL